MRKKKRKITEVLMECRRCGWVGTVYECDCDSDSDYDEIEEDEGRLRCPKCQAVVKQINEG